MLWWNVAMVTALILGYGVVAAIIIHYLWKPFGRGKSREETSNGHGPDVG